MRETLQKKKIRRQLMLVSLLALGLLLLLLLKPAEKERYVVDQQGNVVALARSDAYSTEEYELIAHVKGEGGSFDKEVRIRQSAAQESTDDGEADIEVAADEAAASLSMAISDIENSSEERVELPETLDDGSTVRWERVETKQREWLLVPALYIFLVAAIISGDREETRKIRQQERREILRALPRFTNQLLLMMNAGMILRDALLRIGKGYAMIPEEQRGLLERNVVQMLTSYQASERSAAALFTEMAGQYTVKELMRIATVLRENEKRGFDIIEDLERESRYLWDNRKMMAKERGKRMDTRMTYPLGMLLVLLIIITMAPAMLAM